MGTYFPNVARVMGPNSEFSKAHIYPTPYRSYPLGLGSICWPPGVLMHVFFSVSSSTGVYNHATTERGCRPNYSLLFEYNSLVFLCFWCAYAEEQVSNLKAVLLKPYLLRGRTKTQE